MTVLDARDVLAGWGTDRMWFGTGLFVYPLFAAFAAMLAAVFVRGGDGPGMGRLVRVMLLTGIVAIAAIPAAFVAAVVVGDRLGADGYRRCEARSTARYVRWDEWVRGGAPCRGRDQG